MNSVTVDRVPAIIDRIEQLRFELRSYLRDIEYDVASRASHEVHYSDPEYAFVRGYRIRIEMAMNDLNELETYLNGD